MATTSPFSPKARVPSTQQTPHTTQIIRLDATPPCSPRWATWLSPTRLTILAHGFFTATSAGMPGRVCRFRFSNASRKYRAGSADPLLWNPQRKDAGTGPHFWPSIRMTRTFSSRAIRMIRGSETDQRRVYSMCISLTRAPQRQTGLEVSPKDKQM
jgi:hypothetical protein